MFVMGNKQLSAASSPGPVSVLPGTGGLAFSLSHTKIVCNELPLQRVTL